MIKIACFIAYGYLDNKKNVDDIITNLLNNKLNNIEIDIYVGWNNKGGRSGEPSAEGYNYNLPLHNINIIEIKKEPHKGSQKAYYTWHNLINQVDIKYDKYVFFKDTYNDNIKLNDILDIKYDLLVYDYYFINSKGPQQNVWQGVKNKDVGYFNKDNLLVCPDTKFMCFNSKSFSKIKDSDFFNKGIRKKQFSIIKFFMPESKVYSLTHGDYINI